MQTSLRAAAVIGGLAFVSVAASLAHALEPPPPTSIMGDRSAGRNLYMTRCASCHDNASDRTPTKESLSSRGPDDIIEALTHGVMRPMAAGLSQTDMEALALYLTGKPALPKVAEGPEAFPCPTADPIRLTPDSWNGWGVDEANTRFQPRPGLKAADVPKLKVKWTFAYTGSKNAQVTAVGDRLFVASNAGRIYSLNAKSGCVYWRADARGGVRAAMTVAKLAGAPSGYAVYVNDDRNYVTALDALSGKQIWQTRVEEHPRAQLTGAAALHDGVLYVPVSSSEEVATNEPDYVCCTFRGSVAALDAKTGKQIWKTYTVDKAPAPHKSAGGKQLMGPAGGAVWSAPTIDAKRGVLYVATGDSYTDVDTKGADAVVAMDLKTGAVKWVNQVTEKDNFMVGCPRTGAAPANCPTPLGPDHDFGASPILKTLANGKQILVAGQKSSTVYGMDPDAGGKTLWSQTLGRGGAAGGVEWGMAADKDVVYVAIADPGAGGKPQLTALRLSDGQKLWTTPAPVLPCPEGRRCVVSQSAPVTAIPGVVFSGAMDGHLRAYDPKTGQIVWDFDTAGQAYDTVNGIKGARGGALDATGPVIVGGMLFQHSGYPGVMMGPGGRNLLIAMSVDGK